MQVVSKFIANLAVTTGKIAANAVTGAKILLGNTEWLRGRNAANSGDINVLRVDATDAVETSGLWKYPTVLPQSPVVPTTNDELTNKAYVDSVSSAVVGGYESLTLTAPDIAAQYVDLATEARADTLQVSVSGVVQTQGVDYTLSVVATKTRITFAGDLATGGAAELVAGDSIQAQYLVA